MTKETITLSNRELDRVSIHRGPPRQAAVSARGGPATGSERSADQASWRNRALTTHSYAD